MLENRDYMRAPRSPALNLSATSILMVVLVVAFAAQCINDVYLQSPVEQLLALTPFALSRGFVWQFITFQFLHVDLWHLLGNLLGLWFFGRFVEHVLGKKRFLLAYFGAGVVGGALQCILMLLFPEHFVPFVFGASAGGMGIFAIFCRLQADSEIRWNFILPIRADVLLWITAAISLFFTLVPSQRGGLYAHAAHLGGILAGLAWVKLGWHRDFVQLPWVEWAQRWSRRHRMMRAARQKGRPVAVPALRGQRRVASSAVENDLSPEDFLTKEVDPILDKISAHGIQSLTEREKRVLESARHKMQRH